LLFSRPVPGEALHWIEQKRPAWLLAGWGCVSNVKFSI
jgi:hypothetical protein